MVKDDFINMCNSHMRMVYDYAMYRPIINLDFFIEKIEYIMDSILSSEYSEMGVDNVWWFIFERCAVNSTLKAYDNCKNEIMYDLSSLYDFIEEDNRKVTNITEFSYVSAKKDMEKCILEVERLRGINIDVSIFFEQYKIIFSILERKFLEQPTI